ncbi:MAG: MarR family transcriptional regulator [Ruminiclostridium sp.]|nr:MarR family transcriptional regulator [Ruminiclostridium sp.]
MSILGYGIYSDTEIQQLRNQYQKAQNEKESWKKGYIELKTRTSPMTQQNENLIKNQEGLNREVLRLNQLIETLKIQGENAIILKQSEKEKGLLQDLNLKTEQLITTQKELTDAKGRIEILQDATGLMYVSENDIEIGYGRTNRNGVRLNLIRIKKQHLTELPLESKDGYDIFADGVSYPSSIMDAIRQKRNSDPKSIETIKPTGTINKTDNFIEPDNETDDSEAVKQDNSEAVKQDNSEAVKQDNTDNEQEGEELEGLSPNQYRVYSFIKIKPGLSFTPIAEQLNIDKGNLSRVLKSLEESNFIRRDESNHFYTRSL